MQQDQIRNALQDHIQLNVYKPSEFSDPPGPDGVDGLKYVRTPCVTLTIDYWVVAWWVKI